MGENLKEGEPQELSPEEKRAQIAEQNRQELLRRREAGELEPYDYEPTYLWYLQRMNQPVTRKDVERHAIVVSPDEFEILGYLEFVNADGQRITIDFTDENFDRSNPLIIFPEELGEEPSSED